jgi:superfamily II DNA helicase RecQ
VLDKQILLVVVLLTGRGKSLLFMVPGCVEEGGMTVVVVLYCALITDLVTRIRGSGIECIE